jgi:squalene synthase HpnC
MPGLTQQEKDSRKELLSFARGHYENFPVISFLVPADIRKDVAAIYWFARTADDIADEGNFSEMERLDKLNAFEDRFKQSLSGKYYHNFDKLLHSSIIAHNLTPSYFTDLLSAFKQDVVKKRYSTYPEVLDYCRRSANPVGRLLLELFDIRDRKADEYSDSICTALQLTNFYQDVSVDFRKGRIYFAADEMSAFGVDEKIFEMNEINDNLKLLVKHNIARTENLYLNGKNLLPYLNGRFRFEIKWTIEGGRGILHKIRKNDYNVFLRPELHKLDIIFILMKSLIK